jgi:hypothetical protein
MNRRRYFVGSLTIAALLVVGTVLSACASQGAPTVQTTATFSFGGEQTTIVEVTASTANQATTTVASQATTTASSQATTTVSSQTVTTNAEPDEASSTTASTASTTSITSTTSTTWRLSADAVAYAESLGGSSHKGDTLYLIVGASVKTEKEAQARLDAATPRFGDMQSYFIVQRSDNFKGLNSGWFIVIEAYRDPPSAENLEFGRRGFPGAYVKEAIVATADPIPVYEEIVLP